MQATEELVVCPTGNKGKASGVGSGLDFEAQSNLVGYLVGRGRAFAREISQSTPYRDISSLCDLLILPSCETAVMRTPLHTLQSIQLHPRNKLKAIIYKQ